MEGLGLYIPASHLQTSSGIRYGFDNLGFRAWACGWVCGDSLGGNGVADRGLQECGHGV